MNEASIRTAITISAALLTVAFSPGQRLRQFITGLQQPTPIEQTNDRR